MTIDGGCKCQSCGRLYKLDVVVDSDIWDKIKPVNSKECGGLLCPQCILTRIEAIYGFSAFKLDKL